jgi:hypothetical protein
MQSRIYVCNFLSAGYKIYARKYYNYTESTKYVYPIVGLNTKYRTSIFSFRCLFGLSNWVVRFVAKKSPFDSKERKAGVTRTALCTGQVIKKKMHRVSAQGTDQHVRVRSKIYLRATVQDGVSS